LDQNLPRRAVSAFKELGIDAVHVHTVKLSGKPDRHIWRYAALNNLIIVTKDVDFTQLHDISLKSPVRVVLATDWQYIEQNPAPMAPP
jgi:predicted nuclease of predicted toxin-antitoxin system